MHPQVIAMREGAVLPEGYCYAIRTIGQHVSGDVDRTANRAETVDLSTPPKVGRHVSEGVGDTPKSAACTRRNATRYINQQAHTSFAREMKDSLVEGRPPTLNVSEDETHLKTRWHAAAKEIAYKLLDLRKEGWRGHSIFDKGKVHKELSSQYKLDPPLDPKRVDKYLAGHFCSSRAVWKAHWQRCGDFDRHHNYPKEAWEKLIQWWPIEACKEESADMVGRRSHVQNASSTGRKSLVERTEHEVSTQ